MPRRSRSSRELRGLHLEVAGDRQQPSFDPGTDGTKYSVPYRDGATAIAMRTDVITAPVDSWSALCEPAHKNQITMFDGECVCFSTAFEGRLGAAQRGLPDVR